jgi:EXLDI family protein
VPNKTIYVAEGDLPLYARAQELAGGNMSAAISTALRRYVEAEEGKAEGLDEITVHVGPGKKGRKVRFVGVQLGEWGHNAKGVVEIYRVYRTRRNNFAVHHETSVKATTAASPDAPSTGWRTWVAEQFNPTSWSVVSAERTLQVAKDLTELEALLPKEIFEIVSAAADQPDLEDLDI